MRMLINDFPRQIGTPHRELVIDENDFFNKINKYNGKKNVYYSVYKPNKDDKFINVIIDKIFLDFDDENAIQDVIKLHEHLLKEDIQHLLIYSGKKGFHVYIFTIKNELKNSKAALKNAHEYFIKLLNINVDQHIVGDIARIARVPNTYHITGCKFCIPLLKNDLYEGIQHIKQKAKSQQSKFTVYGQKLFDMTQFDTNVEYKEREHIDTDFTYQIPFSEKIIKKFPKCVQHWLENPDDFKGIHNSCRYWFAVCCREMYLPSSLCDEIAKYYWDKSKNRYKDFCIEKQIYYAYKSKDDKFMMCDNLIKKKLCLKKCDDYAKTDRILK